jgi:hypothetical protein
MLWILTSVVNAACLSLQKAKSFDAFESEFSSLNIKAFAFAHFSTHGIIHFCFTAFLFRNTTFIYYRKIS